MRMVTRITDRTDFRNFATGAGIQAIFMRQPQNRPTTVAILTVVS